VNLKVERGSIPWPGSLTTIGMVYGSLVQFSRTNMWVLLDAEISTVIYFALKPA